MVAHVGMHGEWGLNVRNDAQHGFLVAGPGFEPGSMGPEPTILDH